MRDLVRWSLESWPTSDSVYALASVFAPTRPSAHGEDWTVLWLTIRQMGK